MRQKYENYTEEDQQVWQVLFDRQMANLPEAAALEFLEGIEKIEFSRDGIPNFDRSNAILKELTGWQLHVVPGLIDDKLFFELLADRKFPASTWLRKMSELDYLEEPDMFHDVFAHVPLLTNQAFVDFLQFLGEIALKHIDNPWAIQLLSRIYWYTVEFGLIRRDGKVRIYGAGILSSAGETKYSLSTEPDRLLFDVDKMFCTPYRKDVFQSKYFVIESFEQLYGSISEVTASLEALLKEEKAA